MFLIFLKSEILSSVFYLAFGLCLLLVPDQTVNIICKIVFGLVMIASGIYHIVIYTAEKEKATILDLFTGVIVMVLGIFLSYPADRDQNPAIFTGALVLVDSIWKIKGSYRLKKRPERTLEDYSYWLSGIYCAGCFHVALFIF
mgnify:CR=1 FL=1